MLQIDSDYISITVQSSSYRMRKSNRMREKERGKNIRIRIVSVFE